MTLSKKTKKHLSGTYRSFVVVILVSDLSESLLVGLLN